MVIRCICARIMCCSLSMGCFLSLSLSLPHVDGVVSQNYEWMRGAIVGIDRIMCKGTDWQLFYSLALPLIDEVLVVHNHVRLYFTSSCCCSWRCRCLHCICISYLLHGVNSKRMLLLFGSSAFVTWLPAKYGWFRMRMWNAFMHRNQFKMEILQKYIDSA